MALKLEQATELPGGPCSDSAGPHPRLAGSTGLECHPGMCISYRSPGGADAAGLGTTF